MSPLEVEETRVDSIDVLMSLLVKQLVLLGPRVIARVEPALLPDLLRWREESPLLAMRSVFLLLVDLPAAQQTDLRLPPDHLEIVRDELGG